MNSVLSLQERELKDMIADLKKVVEVYDSNADIMVKISDGKQGDKYINIVINDDSEIYVVFDRIDDE